VVSGDACERTFPIRSYHPHPMWSKRETLQFTVKLGLRKGLAVIRGMRRSLSDAEQERVAGAIVEHLELSRDDRGRSTAARPRDEARDEMRMKNDDAALPIPNAIVVTEPHAHRAAAAKLRACGKPGHGRWCAQPILAPFFEGFFLPMLPRFSPEGASCGQQVSDSAH
jgi:hypothetical protein